MAFRSLTDVYILMRNNAISNRTVFHDNQFSDDRTALVLDMESGSARTMLKTPPEWTNEVDEIHFEITKIKNKLKELSTLHDKHLNRPTLDDNQDEENTINLLTQDVTQILNQSQLKLRKLSTRSNMLKSGSSDQRLIKNVVNNLANLLQDLTTNFRKSQNAYLKKVQSRKERSNMLFDTSQYLSSNAIMTEDNGFDDESWIEKPANNSRQIQEQIQVNRLNSKLINQRETEIDHILKSINELSTLFNDLATMVSDQGTVLDRIDFNIERVAVSVEGGLQQLEKASKYQKNSRKMYFITVLAIIFLILFILLVITKF